MFEGSSDRVRGGAAGGVAAPAEAALGRGELSGSILDVAFSMIAGLAADVGSWSGVVVPASCAGTDVGSVAFAELLDGRGPGVDLVDLLESVEPADLHDAGLVEAIAGWERVTSLAAARQGDLIAELARRRAAAGMGEFVGDEVATRLVMTRAVAEAKVGLAVCLDLMPAVHDALTAGVIDVRKATALTQALAHQPLATVLAIHEEVLPDAPDLTVPALRARIRRAELVLDPDAATKRHTRERADRHVTLTPAPDAMAWLSAYLPADAAMAAYTALDAIAADADPTDPTPIGARRADALTDILTHILNTGMGSRRGGEERQTRGPGG